MPSELLSLERSHRDHRPAGAGTATILEVPHNAKGAFKVGIGDQASQLLEIFRERSPLAPTDLAAS